MIDVHFHCLPGVDDGPANWDEAVALCREAAAQGTHAIVATPHVHRPPWVNEDVFAREALRRELNERLGGEPEVLAGCEYAFGADAIDLWERGIGGPLVGINGTAALLVEFAPDVPWRTIESAVHEFSIVGTTLVFAHPERHPKLSSDPGALASLVERGASLQITAGALLGDFGERPQAAVEEMLRQGLVHLVGSDAHSLLHRPPRLRDACERVRRRFGEEVAETIFDRNPVALLAGLPIPAIPSAPVGR